MRWALCTARPMPPVSPCARWLWSGISTPTGLARTATTRRGARRSTTSMASSITPTGSTTSSSPPPWEGGNYEPRNPMESGIGYSGYKHQKGEKVIAMTDNNGYVLAPLPVAPVHETDMVLLSKGLQALKQVAKEVGLDLRGAYVNLDGGFDSRANRKCIFNAGMIPNIKENPRNRKTTKRGRKRFFNAAIHALRMRVERTFAWEDKFKRLLLRFERIQQRHYGMKLMAYTLINLRAFCGT